MRAVTIMILAKKAGLCALRLAEYGSLALQIVQHACGLPAAPTPFDAGKGRQVMKCIQLQL